MKPLHEEEDLEKIPFEQAMKDSLLDQENGSIKTQSREDLYSNFNWNMSLPRDVSTASKCVLKML